jgi:hypothetical protein
MVGIPPHIRENKMTMLEIKQSQFQDPYERITSIKNLNKQIAQSKEIKEWELEITLAPEECQAKILQRP